MFYTLIFICAFSWQSWSNSITIQINGYRTYQACQDAGEELNNQLQPVLSKIACVKKPQ